MNWSDPAADPVRDIRETLAASRDAGLGVPARTIDADDGPFPCPVCGGPTHYVLLMASEEVNCDDASCKWDGVVIDTLDD